MLNEGKQTGPHSFSTMCPPLAPCQSLSPSIFHQPTKPEIIQPILVHTLLFLKDSRSPHQLSLFSYIVIAGMVQTVCFCLCRRPDDQQQMQSGVNSGCQGMFTPCLKKAIIHHSICCSIIIILFADLASVMT